MGYSIRIVLDTRRRKKDGTFPVRLRVTSNRKIKEYGTVFSMTDDAYHSIDDEKITEAVWEMKAGIAGLERGANQFAKTIQFSHGSFERRFLHGHPLILQRSAWVHEADGDPLNFDYSPYLQRFPIFKEDHTAPCCISKAYLEYIKYLLQQDRLGNALNYQNSFNSIKKFKGNVCFCDITPGFLFQFEKWMLERGRALATVGIQLRPLRCLFNEAITQGLIDKVSCYPFGKRKYIIPKTRRKNKAIDIDEIAAIYYYEPTTKEEERARDFWIFCYLANGMNLKDVAQLQYKDFEEDSFSFIRAKTAMATRGDPREVVVYLTDDLTKLIDKWGTKDKALDNYVFPIYGKGQSVFEKHYACRAFVRLVNDRMKKIAVKLGIEKKVTTSISRHSFSTQLKRSGASTEFIQEALGHTDKRTTEYYLGSFEKSVKKEFAHVLTAFKRS